MNLRVHYIQHEPFEDLGSIRNWLSQNNIIVSFTHIWENAQFPSLDSFDLLIIMGGSMSVNDNEILPWLKAEKEFIKSAIDNNKKVLGICLGAQLIANVLGAKVYQGKHKEIGWFSVTMSESALKTQLFSKFPSTFTTMHWHGETFDLPKNSTLIASSELTTNQGFIFNDKVVALQFHSEMNEQAINGMINETVELRKAAFTQTIDEIKQGFFNCSLNNLLIFSLLDEFCKS
jgi:GMP synthase (glutamine-hydrolysing)